MSLTMSVRLCCVLPLVQNVPGFSGIRIHTGNVVDDTEKCIPNNPVRIVRSRRYPTQTDLVSANAGGRSLHIVCVGPMTQFVTGGMEQWRN
jgi:hypothetical protein